MSPTPQKQGKVGSKRTRSVSSERKMSFGAILDAAERLSLEDQEELADLLGKHIREEKRAEIAADVRNSLRDFRAGKCLPKTAAELAAEILE